MTSFKTLILGASVLAIGLGVPGAGNSAHAAQGTSEYVKNVDLDFTGPDVIIHVKNNAANKNVNNVNLGVIDSKIDIGIDGFVECKDANNVEFMTAEAYFGSVGIGGFGQLTTSATLHSQKVDVAYKEKGNVAEATEDTFSVPLNKIKNGHPALRVDPVEEINKKLQAHLNGGGNKADFYKQDQQVVLQRPVSLGAVCGKLKDTDKRSVGFETKNVTIKISYEGDPAVNDKPVLNAQLNQNNMPNQVGNNFPIKLDKADFQPNMPNYIGKCVPDQNQKIQIDLQFSGNGAGYLDLKVIPVSNTYADYGIYYQFENIPVNAQATKKIDFSFPLKTMLEQDKYAYMAIADGKTYNHNMKIQARYKPKEGGAWSAWKDYDTAVFKHRCTPQVGVQVGGQGGKLGFDNGGQQGQMPKLQLKQGAVDPDPQPEMQIKSGEGGEGKAHLLLPAVQKVREAR